MGLNGSLLISDPPYGVSVDYDCYFDSWANLELLAATSFDIMRRSCDRMLLTPGILGQYAWPRPDWTMAWVCPSGAGSGPWGFTCWQPITAYGKPIDQNLGRRPDILIKSEQSEQNGHPCPKPIGVWKWIIERGSRPGDLVIDPFMGSGTTLRACKDLGRKAIGIEISEKYCEIAAKRLAQEVLFGNNAAQTGGR